MTKEGAWIHQYNGDEGLFNCENANAMGDAISVNALVSVVV